MNDRMGCWYCGIREGENHAPWCGYVLEDSIDDDENAEVLESGEVGKAEDGSQGGEK